jgi:hypothetical protein
MGTMKKNLPKRRFVLRRFSPFLLCTVFLVFYFFHMIFIKAGTTLKDILFVMLIANMVYMDFALWNYFKGEKKKIWIIEIIISIAIIYFLFNVFET